MHFSSFSRVSVNDDFEDDHQRSERGAAERGQDDAHGDSCSWRPTTTPQPKSRTTHDHAEIRIAVSSVAPRAAAANITTSGGPAAWTIGQ